MAHDLGTGLLFECAKPNANVRGITDNARIDRRATIGAKRAKCAGGTFVLADNVTTCQQAMVLNRYRNVC